MRLDEGPGEGAGGPEVANPSAGSPREALIGPLAEFHVATTAAARLAPVDDGRCDHVVSASLQPDAMDVVTSGWEE